LELLGIVAGIEQKTRTSLPISGVNSAKEPIWTRTTRKVSMNQALDDLFRREGIYFFPLLSKLAENWSPTSPE
jgi:hypothetical protein